MTTTVHHSATIAALAMCAVLSRSAPAAAVPGPDSVAVLANEATAASVDLMHLYAEARHLPAGQLCTVDVPPYADLLVGEFQAKIVTPLVDCLTKSGALPRIEAVVLMRGMPRRLFVAGQPGNLRVSLAAALAIARSVRKADDVAVVGMPPGVKVADSNAWRATWSNPYTKGPFRAGFEETVGPYNHRMWLVTALDGYSYADAALLIDSALAARPFDLGAQWLLMKGADKARAALDGQYPAVQAQLEGMLPAPVAIEDFKTNLTGRHLGAFVTGTAQLGDTIEANTWAAGALVDNLTSFGAHPDNFVAPEVGGTQVQVSIGRWVRAGVAGVHGTVSEPLNNCFPSRQFLVDYAAGATLAEAFWQNLPYLYWMNLVLGDPMVAPFAKRPTLALVAVAPTTMDADQGWVDGDQSAHLEIIADAGGDPIGQLRIFVDDVLVADAKGAAATIELSAGAHTLVAVAQAAKSDSGAGVWQSKGWQAWTLTVASTSAGAPGEDAGGDGGDGGDGEPGAGAGDGSVQAGGCSARPASGGRTVWLWLAGLAACGVAMRRRARPVWPFEVARSK